jgi:2-hydroxycyclohexanecarboxyl-CoA dehydrogenase
MRGLSGKIVIVTGGGGGIGGATCQRFAEAGATVAVFDINAAAAEAVADAIASAGGQAEAVACDITDYTAVAAAVGGVSARHGRVDALVNNAGWDVFRLFKDSTPAEWRRLVDINLMGALNVTHCVLPGMMAQGSGRIIMVASDAARVGSSGEAVYAACKAGLIGFAKTLAREHARHAISVNVVCPGATNTALFAEYKRGAGNPDKLEEAFRRSIPMRRIGEPEDLPGAILFFASDDAAFITGQVLSVSGGLTMAG